MFFSVSESRVELMGPAPKYSVASASLRRENSDSDNLHIDTDGENCGIEESSGTGLKRKSKCHGHHGHRKKCKNHRKHREEKNLDDALQGTLNGMELLIESAEYHDRVQANEYYPILFR